MQAVKVVKVVNLDLYIKGQRATLTGATLTGERATLTGIYKGQPENGNRIYTGATATGERAKNLF